MIDLHLHLDGSLTPEDIITLADMQGVELPTRDIKELKKYLVFDEAERTLTHYLTYFDLPIMVMQTKETISKSVELLVSRLARLGMVYAEIRFAPLLHTRQGLSIEEVVVSAIDGLKKGLTDGKFACQLILCCMRKVGTVEQNLETVECVRKYLNRGVCAVDLAGDEVDFNYDDYKEVFDKVKYYTLPCTIHAGERGGVNEIETALKLGAERIGHGVHIADSDELVDKIERLGIGVEMCPTSNYQTGAIGDMKDYPIKKYIEKGIPVSVNTDSMVVSDTSIMKEFELLKRECGLTIEDKVKCFLNAVRISFAPDTVKEVMRMRIIAGLARLSEN